MAGTEPVIDFSKYILNDIQCDGAEIRSLSSQSASTVNIASLGVV